MFKQLTVADKQVKLQIWDTAGQERYRSLTTAYYRGSHAILLAFDLSNEDGLKHLADRLQEIRSYNSDNSEVPIFLVGTKSDKLRAINQADIDAFGHSHGLQGYFETSAKNNQGVLELFEGVTKQLIDALEPEPAVQINNMERGQNPSSSGFLSRHIGKILAGAIMLGGIAALVVFTGGLALTLLPLAKGFIVGGAALIGVVGGVMAGRRQDKKDREAARLDRWNNESAEWEAVGGSLGRIAQRGVSVGVNPRVRAAVEPQSGMGVSIGGPMFPPSRKIGQDPESPSATVNGGPSLSRSGSEDKS